MSNKKVKKRKENEIYESKYFNFNEEEKWDGYSKSLSDYFQQMYYKCNVALGESSYKTTAYPIFYYAGLLLQAIYYANIQTLAKFDESTEIKKILETIKSVPFKNNDWCDEDVGEYRDITLNISFLLEELVTNSTAGHAQEVVQFYRVQKKSGIELIKCLIKTFGITKAQIAMIPYLFKWDMFDEIERTWFEYKKCLDAHYFFRCTPNFRINSNSQG